MFECCETCLTVYLGHALAGGFKAFRQNAERQMCLLKKTHLSSYSVFELISK